ncbi:hypothetical protein J6590_082239 [Homalodisca vitripennis]|nr:hypothetical protein J6590_082239 [Homalodisca vitripennis]
MNVSMMLSQTLLLENLEGGEGLQRHYTILLEGNQHGATVTSKDYNRKVGGQQVERDFSAIVQYYWKAISTEGGGTTGGEGLQRHCTILLEGNQHDATVTAREYNRKGLQRHCTILLRSNQHGDTVTLRDYNRKVEGQQVERDFSAMVLYY